jgi:hypothetical protein
MAPLHAKRKFWWELIFISVLLFLLAGVRVQRKQEVAAAAPALLAPSVALTAVLKPLPVLALK